MELGQYGIVPNYFEQNQAQALDPRLTVLETLVRCGGRGAARGQRERHVDCGCREVVTGADLAFNSGRLENLALEYTIAAQACG